MKLTPSDNRKGISSTRKQFPVKVAFAMTINKSQGQTFDMVGVYLPKHVFTHGQLYVAASRVGRRCGLRFMVVTGTRGQGEVDIDGQRHVFTTNPVYRDVLLP